jgi:hypothetical protein
LIVLIAVGGLAVGSVFAAGAAFKPQGPIGAVSKAARPTALPAGYGTGPVTGTATGKVLVDGKPFKSGPIPYGAVIVIQPGGTLTLKGDVETFTLYPPAGESIQFVLVRSSDVFTLGLAAGPDAKPKPLPVVEIDLRGQAFARCSSTAAAKKKPLPGRRVWARGVGRLRTEGRYAAATASAPAFWLTNDRCDGTLISVKRGTLKVSDFPRKATVFVQGGKSYLAKPVLRVTCSISTSVGHHVEVTCAAGRRNAAKPYDIVVGGRVVARGTVRTNGSFVARFTATLPPGTPVTVRISGKAVASVRA